MNVTFHIDLHPDVESDYGEAYHWYELQQEGLGERFLLSVRNKIMHVQMSPETYSVKSRKEYREAWVDNFPYVIVYKIYPRKKRIFISAIHHEKMHPNKKYRK